MATLTEVGKVKRDTGVTSVLLTDPQISDIIDENGGIHELAVAHVLEVMATDANARGSLQVGKYKESYFEQAKGLMKSAGEWRKKVIRGKPFAGGISLSDKQARCEDEDRNNPIFYKGIDSGT